MTLKSTLMLAPLLALGLAAPALAERAPIRGEEARIPFANDGGIRDWRSADSDTIYIQDRHRTWYEATLMGSAFDLPYSWAIGFDTGPVGTLDRFSTVVVRGHRYPIKSLVKLAGEPPKKHRDRDDA